MLLTTLGNVPSCFTFYPYPGGKPVPIDVNALIVQAKNAIGEELQDDWKIAPSDHAQQFKETAPALSAILEDPLIDLAADRYEEDNQAADEAQEEFKQAARKANQFVLAISCIGAILLTAGVLLEVDTTTTDLSLERIIFIGLGVLSILLAIFAQRWLLLLRQGDLLKNWMTNRAKAEANRLQYFKAIIDLEPPLASSRIPVTLLKLEYFRRFLLKSQIKFFKQRGQAHRQAARKRLNWSTWAVTLGTGMMALSGFLAPYNSKFSALAAIGTIATALAAFISVWESINQDQRNADRYRNTRRSLEDLLPHLTNVRKLAAADNTDAVSAFFDSASEVLTEEHRQWLADLDKRNLAVARLEQTLKDLESEQAQKTAPTAPAEPTPEEDTSAPDAPTEPEGDSETDAG